MALSNRVGLTKREDGMVISTIESSPLVAWYGRYETAVSIDHSFWRIAKGYDTLEDAIKGHARFSSMTKEELMEYKYID